MKKVKVLHYIDNDVVFNINVENDREAQIIAETQRYLLDTLHKRGFIHDFSSIILKETFKNGEVSREYLP